MRNTLKINFASSYNSGILFYSKRHMNYFVVASTDNSGNAKAIWTTIQNYKKYEVKYKHHNLIAKLKNFALFQLPFMILLFICVQLAFVYNFILALRIWSLCYSVISLCTFFLKVYITKRHKKNLYKFHAAEHMVLNAYQKLNEIPTLNNIWQFSRFHKDCSTNKITKVIIISFILFLCTFLPNLWYILIGMVTAVIIIAICSCLNLLNFLQHFTTCTPTNKELEIAIVGMKCWLEHEKEEKIKIKFSS